jgi:hypothetical protein
LSRPPEHLGDVFRRTDIALNNEPVGSEPAHFAEHIVCGDFIAAVVDCYLTPCSANFSAIPRPMPRELPVISAYFPLSDMRNLRFSVIKGLAQGDDESFVFLPLASPSLRTSGGN